MRTAIALLISFLLLLTAACVGTGARTRDLLARDHQTMNDQELIAYYYQINDQIAREERSSTGTSVGLGVGRGPIGVGISQGVSRGTVAEELRDRRNEVRTELTRRGLRP